MRRRSVLLVLGLVALVAMGSVASAQQQRVRIAMLVKSLGNGFFEAARDGGMEAAKQLGANVELIYTGPTAATAEGQIEIINNLIAQRVDAIVISANDPNALIPATKRAMERGIKVISFDSGIAAGGRLMHLNPSNVQLIGQKQIDMISKTLGAQGGEIAVLSATAQATNQNAWIAAMRQTLQQSQYRNLRLVDVVYGDDQSDKSYREALALFQKYPNLRGIIAPTTVGIAAAAKAVQDRNLVGKVFVTGLGLPSEMAGYVKAGSVQTFAIWNPIDLGYSAVFAAYQFVTNRATGKAGERISIGRMGTITLDDKTEAAMAEPFTFDKNNVDRFAKIF
ncbi:MAG: rhamnose ABC transporter substrate-binding protein [Meiothermus sp.]|nr:rhamnose ABC transporter substrate-binding protein [Meiothermus sp.]